MKTETTINIRSSIKRALTPLLVTALLCTLAISPSVFGGSGNHGNPGVLPPNSHPHGRSYSEWAEAWWQWALSIPADRNPLFDQTGANAAQGQSGSVWFLAGVFGASGTAERTITVPKATALFLPLFNTVYLGFPCDSRNLPGCADDQALEAANDVAKLVSFISGSMDGAALSCVIDGRPLRNLESYREQSSEWFQVTMPEGNVFQALGYSFVTAGPYDPCVDTGYYLMLAPLSPGSHTIRFTSRSADHSFGMDITYHLMVGK